MDPKMVKNYQKTKRQTTHLWELCDQVVGYLHGVVEEVECLSELLSISRQHLRDGNNYVLDLIFLEAKLYFTHLWNTFS